MPEGHSIRRFANVHSKAFKGTNVRVSSPQGRFSEEAKIVDGLEFGEPTTHGKHLFFHLDDYVIHVHLGLYGWFNLEKARVQQERDTVRLKIENDVYASRLTAPTKCELITADGMNSIISRLGPDPLHEDTDPEPAWHKISKSKKSIGALLMDQSVIAGIGNVYRAEILHRCELDPYTPGAEVSKEKFTEIWNDSVYLLKIGSVTGRIETVPHAFLSHEEQQVGGHAQFTYVYKRTGQPCRVCGSSILEKDLEGRTLYWCPACQK